MAESQKKNSSSVSLKEKDSLLGDVDLGKDFLSSWKQMSMADGDAMDFDLTRGNKKPFNFDKADMDFNLDGDSGNLPSFNMDMSDLDRHESGMDLKISREVRMGHRETSMKSLDTLSSFPLEHGTTVIGCASEDDNYIVVMSDGRTFVEFVDKKKCRSCPVSEDTDKIWIYKDLIFSCSGCMHYGEKLIQELAKLYNDDSKATVENLIERRHLDVNAWKKDDIVKENDGLKEAMKRDGYPASVIVYALDKKFIHVAASSVKVFEFMVGRKKIKVVGHGFGGKIALQHFMENKDRVVSLDGAIDLMKEALGAASLQTAYCGGKLCTAIGTSDGIKFAEENRHVTDIISPNFENLQKYTMHMVLFFAIGSYLERPVKEKNKEEGLLLAVPGLQRVGILGFREDTHQTVRWLLFRSEADIDHFINNSFDWEDSDFMHSQPTKSTFEWLSPLLKKSIKGNHQEKAAPNFLFRIPPVKAGEHSAETVKTVFTHATEMTEGDDGTLEDQAAFMKEIESFYPERAIDFKPLKFYGQPLNCLKLWRAVIRLGGYDRVTGSKLWRQVGESFHPPKTCTTVSWTFRIFYKKSLLEYERHMTQSGELQLPVAAFHEASAADAEGNGYQGSGVGRARRDAAARAMQGWHVQRLFGNGEVGEPVIKVRVQSDPAGRLVITGQPEQVDNP